MSIIEVLNQQSVLETGKSVSAEMPYNPALFVGRESEMVQAMTAWQDFVGLIDARKTGDKSCDNYHHPKSVSIVGPQGIGKSWLLGKVEQEITAKDSSVGILRLDLKRYQGQDIADQVFGLLGDLIQQMSAAESLRGNADLKVASQKMMTVFGQIYGIRRDTPGGETPVAILVDSVHDVDWHLLAGAEDLIFGPLIEEPNVFVALAGGRFGDKLYPWKSSALRAHAKFIDLENFSESEAIDQGLLLGASADLSRRIYQISGGNPALTALTHECNSKQEAVIRSFAYLFESLAASSRNQIVNSVLALCVLEGWTEDLIPPMLAAYFNQPELIDLGYQEQRQVKDLLVHQWGGCKFDTGKGFVIDETSRRTAELYLQTQAPKKWRQLHETAKRQYEAWADHFRDNRIFWLKKARYHQAILASVNVRINENL